MRARDAVEAALPRGFSRAALLPARALEGYAPNKEAEKQGIVGDPRLLLDGAKSVLVAAMPFAWHTPWPQGYGEVSAFYFYSHRAHEALRLLAGDLRAAGAAVDIRQRLPQKLLAVEAGFGVQGRNTLVASPAWGTCFTLRSLVTDIPADGSEGEGGAQPPGKPSTGDSPSLAHLCSGCRRCVEACPTGALDGRGNLDIDRCLRARMLTGEIVPETLRAPMGARLLGCELCQRVCPRNASVPLEAPEALPFALETLLVGARRDLDEIGKRVGWNVARLERLRAQAALAAGNSGDGRYLPLLKGLLGSRRPAVAAHARWAVEQLEGGTA